MAARGGDGGGGGGGVPVGRGERSGVAVRCGGANGLGCERGRRQRVALGIGEGSAVLDEGGGPSHDVLPPVRHGRRCGGRGRLG